MDITEFMTWFLNWVVTWFRYCFGILENIKFLGTDLLTFTITLMFITTLVPIILALARPRNFKEMRVNKNNGGRTNENN